MSFPLLQSLLGFAVVLGVFICVLGHDPLGVSGLLVFFFAVSCY